MPPGKNNLHSHGVACYTQIVASNVIHLLLLATIFCPGSGLYLPDAMGYGTGKVIKIPPKNPALITAEAPAAAAICCCCHLSPHLVSVDLCLPPPDNVDGRSQLSVISLSLRAAPPSEPQKWDSPLLLILTFPLSPNQTH